MSNPGVIRLASLSNVGPNIDRFDIEDNIGEAIHIHLNGFRIDMTVSEFLRFADDFKNCVNVMGVMDGIGLQDFDPNFLFRMGPLVAQIKDIRIEKRKLKDLRCLVFTTLPILGCCFLPRTINRCPAYRFLKGEARTFVNYDQDGYPELNNEARINSLEGSIRNFGYPHKNQFIILFGDQDYIRDGQHRAAILAANSGLNQSIPVMVIDFKVNSWRMHPYRAILGAIFYRIHIFVIKKSKSILHALFRFFR